VEGALRTRRRPDQRPLHPFGVPLPRFAWEERLTPPTLHTPRLILRPPAAEDFPAFCDYMADPVTVHIGGPLVPSAAWRVWAMIIGAWTLNGYSMFSVVEKSSGQWIGRLGPWAPLGWPEKEIGWGIISAAQGKGYAVEAASACMDFVFDALGWTQVCHTIAPDNYASQRVAQRLGSTNQGPTKLPPPIDHFPVEYWGQTRAQWKAR